MTVWAMMSVQSPLMGGMSEGLPQHPLKAVFSGEDAEGGEAWGPCALARGKGRILLQPRRGQDNTGWLQGTSSHPGREALEQRLRC